MRAATRLAQPPPRECPVTSRRYPWHRSDVRAWRRDGVACCSSHKELRSMPACTATFPLQDAM